MLLFNKDTKKVSTLDKTLQIASKNASKPLKIKKIKRNSERVAHLSSCNADIKHYICPVNTPRPMPAPLNTFIIYSRHDAKFKDELLIHLDALVRKGHIRRWVDTDLLPGEEWEKRIEAELDAAHLVLMLVSAHALNSDFIQKKELKTALDKKKSGSARIIPILVRDCLWELEEDLAALQMLPKHESNKFLAIESWSSSSAAWASTLRELLKLIQEIQEALEKESAEKVQAEKERTAAEAKQATAAEQEKRRHKKDEQTWVRLQQEITAADSFEEKIEFIQLYLNDPECQNHREAARDQLHDLEADREAHKIVEAQKQKVRAERAAQAAAQQRRKTDETAWETALLANTIADFETYLAQKEHTLHRAEAEQHIADLKIPKYKNGDTLRHLPYTPEMVYLEGGSFEMGSSENKDEKPIHTVTLSPFWIGKYPITVEEYAAYCNDKGINMPDGNKKSRHPVVNVNWEEASAYTTWLSQKIGHKYRLPTESEWEYAARGGNIPLLIGEVLIGGTYAYAGSNNIDEVAWYLSNSEHKSHPVGEKKSNQLGLHDMSGNVREWCWDWYGPYTSTPKTNPTGSDSGSGRVIRGGGAWFSPDFCRSTYRDLNSPTVRRELLGFRVVLLASQ
jgi:formylglycine-generating enzyme